MNINDFIFKKEKIDPVTNKVNFEIPAQQIANASEIPLRKSNPPRNITKPIMTTICISNLLLLGIWIARRDSIRIGRPNIEGIKEVTELLSLK